MISWQKYVPIPGIPGSLRGVGREVVRDTGDGRPADQEACVIAFRQGNPQLRQPHTLFQFKAVGASRLADQQQVTEEEHVALQRWGRRPQRAKLDRSFHDEGTRRQGTVAADCTADIQARPFAKTLRLLKIKKKFFLAWSKIN